MAKRKGNEFWVPVVVICLIVVALVVGLVVAIQPFADPYGCDTTGKSHTISEKSSGFSPDIVTAQKCDTLTFTNDTSGVRTVMFGDHSDMITYDGVMSKRLDPGQSFTVTLGRVGNFDFHDHDAGLTGSFSVE